MGLVAPFAVPSVYADLLTVLVLGRAFGKPEVYTAVVGEFSAGSLGEEILTVCLVDVMEWFVGALAILGIHAFVDVACDFLAVLDQVDVFAGIVLPLKSFFGEGVGEAWGEEGE